MRTTLGRALCARAPTRAHARVGRRARRRRPGDRRERVDAGERAQHGARRHDRVQPLQDQRAAAPRRGSSVWPGTAAARRRRPRRPRARARRRRRARRASRAAAAAGSRTRLPRANEPAIDATLCRSAAPTSAPARPASGVYGELAPLCRKCGASRAPIIAPATSPPSESAVAISPRRSPASAEMRGDRQHDPVDAASPVHVSRAYGRSSRLANRRPLHCSREPGA